MRLRNCVLPNYPDALDKADFTQDHGDGHRTTAAGLNRGGETWLSPRCRKGRWRLTDKEQGGARDAQLSEWGESCWLTCGGGVGNVVRYPGRGFWLNALDRTRA